ncbi:3-deoxy-D-manno-octulosonic acid transferase [Pukyongiella litopenaei]|uniref:3-deoxy-D-manno-octulosonic acid transferase n=1 Tax=Pukyongiella litopenaei TaxID=2605946 RepID=A0A2S0MNG1_9RHOB|nr:glycosyltransferase N-terminal domain-containing protein [Pukyongiella litopenaei]AVO37415.1 3-deoxy-D-manno-octulosonic acid transferase [Pukyongiella litopenaei]
MGRSLSLAAYHALSRRRAPPDRGPVSPRPKGELVWLHAASADRLPAVDALGRRLQLQRDHLNILVTAEDGGAAALVRTTDPQPEIFETLTSDHPAANEAFLDHWRPDLCLWAGGILLPNLLTAARSRGIPMLLFDVNAADFQIRSHGWLPDLLRASLNCFDTVMVTGARSRDTARRVGLPEAKLQMSEPLCSSPMPPLCADSDLAQVTADLAARPAWLVAHARGSEADDILRAHRYALRLLHRLLLIVAAASPQDAAALAVRLGRSGLRVADWDAGEGIEDNVQVVLARDGDDLGLWYRLAPLTFVGGTLAGPGTTGNPLDAAALGSALLCGPYRQGQADAWNRLFAAGAARAVSDGDALGEAVVELIAPDTAAAMALAGWETVTEGAGLVDQLGEMVQDLLDRRGASHAGT